ncbi:MAG: hypothetical protein R6W68_03130 [Ignavibacteriaceae bacterium]
MKKTFLLIFISAITFISCEKDFTGVIDYEVYPYQVTTVSPSGNILFNVQDSLITIKLDFTSLSKVSQVSFDIFSSANVRLNQQRILLHDNGLPEFGDNVPNDNKFANKFPLSSQYPIGTYYIRYYIADQLAGDKLIAQSSFIYDNGQTNVAPVLLNLSIPDQVNLGETFIFSVEVVDENGLNDVQIVFFELFRPDGSQVEVNPGNTRFLMHDDGNFEIFGDEVAGDGIYSFKNSFGVDATIGTWRFEFQAEDRGGLLSNKIIHTIIVQ